MTTEPRYCTECRAEIPEGEGVCPSCGVYAGDVFDGKLPRKKRSGAWLWVLAVIVIAATAVFVLEPWKEHVVPRSRTHLLKRIPANERGAMQVLREFLTTSERREECVALISKGTSSTAWKIYAVDRCKHQPIGEFNVDRKTGKVTKH